MEDIHDRFLLFDSGVTCGIFTDGLYIVLSPEAGYTHISHGSFKEIHITKYVPRKYEWYAGKVLIFRNRFSHMPPCIINRLCGTFYTHCRTASKFSRWDIDDQTVSAKTFMSSNSFSRVSLCSFGRLVKYRGPVSQLDCGNIVEENDSEEIYSITESIFPILRCPYELYGLLMTLSGELKHQGQGNYILTSALRPFQYEAAVPYQVLHDFREISAELHRLQNSDKYPASQMVVLEYCNGSVFSCSEKPDFEVSGSTSVEYWQDDVFARNFSSGADSFDHNCSLVLKGDRVHAAFRGASGVDEIALHVSLYEYEGELLQSENLDYPRRNKKISSSVMERALSMRAHVLHLLALREHVHTSFHLGGGVCTNSDRSKEWKLVYRTPTNTSAVQTEGQFTCHSDRPPSLVVHSYRSEEGDHLSLLAGGSVRGVFRSCRILLELPEGSNVRSDGQFHNIAEVLYSDFIFLYRKCM